MTRWVKSVTATFQEQQVIEKMARYKAEQDAKRERWATCELCGGTIDTLYGICVHCGQIQTGD